MIAFFVGLSVAGLLFYVYMRSGPGISTTMSGPTLDERLVWADFASTTTGDVSFDPDAPGLVEMRYPGFMAGYALHVPDVETYQEQGYRQYTRQINDALMSLGFGWQVHMDAVRIPYRMYPAAEGYLDPTLVLLDKERAKSFESATEGQNYLYTHHFLYLSWQIATGKGQKLAPVFFENIKENSVSYEALRDDFEQKLASFENVMPPDCRLRRLTAAEIQRQLYFAMTGFDQPVRPGLKGHDIAAGLGAFDFFDGHFPHYGQYVGVVELLNFPHHCRPLGAELDALGIGYRWSSRLITLGYHETIKLLSRRQSQWWMSRKTFSEFMREMFTSESRRNSRAFHDDAKMLRNRSAERYVEEITELMADVDRSETLGGLYTTCVLVYGPTVDEVETKAKQIAQVFNAHGYVAALATTNTTAAYHGSLPGNGRDNIRRPALPLIDAVAMMPTHAPWMGSVKAPCRYFKNASGERADALLVAATEGSTPFHFNYHAGDVGHTLLIAKTGAGKSVHVNFSIAQFLVRYPGAHVYLFDKDRSGELLCRAAGGLHYDLDPDSDELQLQPLRYLDNRFDREEALDWLLMLFALNDVTVTAEERQEIQGALEILAQIAPEERTILYFMTQLRPHRLKQVLAELGKGMFAPVFRATTDSIGSSQPYQVFEMATLIGRDDRVLLPMLLLLLNRIERTLDGRHDGRKGRPTLIVIEEAWMALTHPVFAGRIETWLRTLRKKNAAVILVGHSLDQIREAEAGTTLRNQCPTVIFGADPEAANTDSETYALCNAFGIPVPARAMIARARKAREYVQITPEGYRIYDLKLSPTALSFLGAPPSSKSNKAALTPAAQRELMSQLIETYGITWPAQWLHNFGLYGSAMFWKSLVETRASSATGEIDDLPSQPAVHAGPERSRPAIYVTNQYRQ